MITFILGGLWHGAGWTFLFWGFLHGAALVIHRVWSSFGFKLWTWLAWFITFNFINIAWVFFRAKEWDDAIRILNSMFSLNNYEEYFNLLQFSWILLTFFTVLVFKNSFEIITAKYSKTIVLFATLFLFFLALLQLTNIIIQEDKVSEFLYFNF